jgi:hypothetical protein
MQSKATIAEQMKEVTMSDLADRLAIQDVMTRYAAGVDDRDMAQYRACFADDVEIVGFGGDPVQGADLWVEDVIRNCRCSGRPNTCWVRNWSNLRGIKPMQERMFRLCII